MHELGIVFHIIRSVEDVARANSLRHVSSVTLQLGEVSGVLPDYLGDCWRWACDKKDLMRGCELVVETIPALTYCENCGAQYGTVEHGRVCPRCGSERTYLLQGNETMIKEIATPDAAPDEELEATSDADCAEVPADVCAGASSAAVCAGASAGVSAEVPAVPSRDASADVSEKDQP